MSVDAIYLSLREAAALGLYTERSLRRELERPGSMFQKGRDYFNRGNKPHGKLLFHRDRYLAALEGREVLDAYEFTKGGRK